MSLGRGTDSVVASRVPEYLVAETPSSCESWMSVDGTHVRGECEERVRRELAAFVGLPSSAKVPGARVSASALARQ